MESLIGLWYEAELLTCVIVECMAFINDETRNVVKLRGPGYYMGVILSMCCLFKNNYWIGWKSVPVFRVMYFGGFWAWSIGIVNIDLKDLSVVKFSLQL